MNPTKEQILDLLPDYVLGVLEPKTMLVVDSYLDEQKDLLRQVRAAEDAFALMALIAPPARPPLDVKQRLMHRVEQDAVRRQLPGAAPILRSPLRPATSMPPRWEMPTSVRNVAALAAVVALAALSIYGVLLSRQFATLLVKSQTQAEKIVSLEMQSADYTAVVDNLRTTIEELQQERNLLVAQANQLAGRNAELDTRVQEISQELSVDQNRLQLLSTASEAVMLDEGAATPQSRGAFYLSGPQGVLIVHGLQPLPESQVYQLWWVTPDGTQLPVAPVEVHADVEPTWAVFDVPAQASPFSVVGLSIEPAGGSAQPTGPMVLEGSITG